MKDVKKHLKKHKIRKYKIILEPEKKNTAPAMLSAALLSEIDDKQTLMFLSADHLIQKSRIFNKALLKNKNKLTEEKYFYIWNKTKFLQINTDIF